MAKDRLARPPNSGNTVIVSRAGLFDSEAEKSTGEIEENSAAGYGQPYSNLTLEFKESRTTITTDADTPGDEFEFSLFSTATKIVRIEDAPIEGPDFAQPAPVAPLVVSSKRPDSYYFVNDKDEARIQRIQSCAISGEDIIAQSTIPWPGMQMPWRVIHIASVTTATKRKKPSKKRRLIIKREIERRQSAPLKTTPFKNNDMRNWKFYNIKTRPKPKFVKLSGKVKEKRKKPYKTAL